MKESMKINKLRSKLQFDSTSIFAVRFTVCSLLESLGSRFIESRFLVVSIKIQIAKNFHIESGSPVV